MATCNCKPKPNRLFAGWIVPTVLLVLLPKCPMCVVAYAAWLGIGLSVSAATALRYGVIAVCVVALAAVVVRRIRSR
jgi:hypothetical protein